MGTQHVSPGRLGHPFWATVAHLHVQWYTTSVIKVSFKQVATVGRATEVLEKAGREISAVVTITQEGAHFYAISLGRAIKQRAT